MPLRHRTPKGSAFIEGIFTGTAIAFNGGPVRRGMATIRSNATLASAYAAAVARGWKVQQIGFYWYFFDARTFNKAVIGTDRTGMPRFAP